MRFGDAVKRIRFAAKVLFHGWTFELTPLEASCLDYFIAALPVNDAAVVAAQRRSIDAVLREGRGKMVVFVYENTKISDLPSFPRKDLTLRVATASVVCGSQRIFVDTLFEFGVLIGLEFSRPPKICSADKFTFQWIRLLLNLADGPDEVEMPTDVALKQLPTFASIAHHIDCDHVLPPNSEPVVGTFLERLACPVPQDFVQLLGETDGFRVPFGGFMGTRARTIPWPDENLILVAEDDRSLWALAFRQHDPEMNLLLLDEESASYDPVEGSFVEAFVQFAKHIEAESAAEAL